MKNVDWEAIGILFAGAIVFITLLAGAAEKGFF